MHRIKLHFRRKLFDQFRNRSAAHISQYRLKKKTEAKSCVIDSPIAITVFVISGANTCRPARQPFDFRITYTIPCVRRTKQKKKILINPSQTTIDIGPVSGAWYSVTTMNAKCECACCKGVVYCALCRIIATILIFE